MAKKNELAVGDEVRFTALFLRSTGQHTGEAPQRRGKVTRIDDIGGARFATVAWVGREPGMVNAFNICRINDRRSYAD